MRNVLEWLEESAARFPDKAAVTLEDHSLSFSGLRSLGLRLGQSLRALERKGDRPVGVMAPRDADTAAYFAAVLYSGNFYVPFDPELPPEKLAGEIEDAGIRVILGKPELEDKTRRAGFAGIYLSLSDAAAEEAPFPAQGGDDPLYMVYTSGSTGRPKGVLKSHASMIAFLESYCSLFSFTEEEIIGNQTPFFFDASAKDIYLMLRTGASIEIIPTQRFALPTELMLFMNEKKISFASWVPTAISLVAQLSPFSMVKPEYLKRLFFVGEVMPMKHLNKWRQALPDLRCVNLYGSSETAGITCCYEVAGNYADTDVLPVGRPLPGMQVYLWGEEGLVTRPGQIGEICVVSDTLALEYWQDPEKTAAAFPEMDFGGGPVRCFKTGDLASWDEEGNLVFASRNDYQIKHMGHRIELGEIEAAAMAIPEVTRSCCLYDARKKRILLYCELVGESSMDAKEIRGKLRSRLSSYMLPGKVVVGQIPLNANGKINRQALQP